MGFVGENSTKRGPRGRHGQWVPRQGPPDRTDITHPQAAGLDGFGDCSRHPKSTQSYSPRDRLADREEVWFEPKITGATAGTVGKRLGLVYRKVGSGVAGQPAKAGVEAARRRDDPPGVGHRGLGEDASDLLAT